MHSSLQHPTSYSRLSHESTMKALSVSELNSQARRLLEMNFNHVRLVGEISGLVRPSSGHWYFSLKDAASTIRCAMFRNRNQRIRFVPTEGMLLLMRGQVSLYEGKGDYQFIVEHMEHAGAGDLQKAFERLKTKLDSLGLFDSGRKKTLPSYPKHIGVITSPTGAAIHDILTVLKRRFSIIPVTIIPSLVQGEEAKIELVQALKKAEKSNLFDVLIIGRGGGSLEDLWPFNEEMVAMAIADCNIPIISAVGHEIDFTISDFVADYRAATPSAAAEIVSPDRKALLNQIELIRKKITTLTQNKLKLLRKEIVSLQKRLRHPKERLRESSQRLDDMEIRLQQAMTLKLERIKSSLGQLTGRLDAQHPQQHISLFQNRNKHLHHKVIQLMLNILDNNKFKLNHVAEQLHTVSPLATLSRGYSITTLSGQIVYNSKQLQKDAKLAVRFYQGQALCKVEELVHHDSD